LYPLRKEPTHLRLRRQKGFYRSGFEKKIREFFDKEGIAYGYESDKLSYTIPETKHKYTPDFVLRGRSDTTLYLEAKGYMDAQTRRKMLCVRACNPDTDLRIVFQNADKTITKNSKTTYGQWATKHGFLWCDGRTGSIPPEWLKEIET
jgi:hypothetical protein